MNKWISYEQNRPKLFEYCQVLDNKGFVSYAVYSFDEDNDGTRSDFYFAEIEAVRFIDGKYECEAIGGEILNVTHYIPLPEGFDDGLGWLREAVSETAISKSSKRDWFDNCKPDEDY